MPLPPPIRWSRISRDEAVEQGLDYYFDPKKADFAVGFFESFLTHSKGRFAGKPFTLLDWQRVDIIEELFGWMRLSDDTRRYRIGYIEIPKKNGKALSLDTPIRTVLGWKTMGDVNVGDLVRHPSGEWTRVVAATDPMPGRPCYAVDCDGEVVIADEGHLWSSSSGVIVTTCMIAGCGGRLPLPQGRRIVSCDPAASTPVRCIQVEAHDGMFLVGRSMIPTHNSTLLSGIGALLTAADREPAAEVYICATSRDQAGIIYRQLAELVKSSEALAELLEIIDSRKTITCVPTNSFCRVISSDSARAEGLNIHGLLYDELHAARDRKLWDAVRYGGASRSQPLILSITTAGADKASICWEQHEYALRVQADPSVDPSFFAYVRAATIDDDYADPAVWRAANPSFGITMDEDSFKADVAEAKLSNSKLSSFLRYRLNIWSSGENKFIDPAKWALCTGMSGLIDARATWYAGLDLAQTWDCNAFVAVSKAADGVFDVICRFWIPGDNAHDRSVKEGVPWERWAEDPKQGVCLTPGNTVDYDFIRRDILAFCKERTVRKIATDPHNSHYLVQQLQAEGLDVVGFSQTPASMNTPTKNLDNLIINSRLRTNENKVLTWMAENAAVIENASGHVKVSKPSPKSHARVDGIIALIMALALAADADAAPPTPEPEILVL